MERKAYVDREICIGCKVCANECPEVFTVREAPEYQNAFKSFPDDGVEQKKIADKVQKVIDFCPVQCISWKEKQIAAAVEQK